MKLTPGELLRNNREREFQKRILAAVEKPNRGRSVWAVLNSPFVIWLFTACMITLVGAYLSANQQCVAEAERIIESVAKLDAEIVQRQGHIIRSINAATTGEELKAAIANRTPLYSEFTGRTLFELIDQKTRLVRKLDLGSDEFIERSQTEWDSIVSGMASTSPTQRAIMSGAYTADLSNVNLSELKDLFSQYNPGYWFNYRLLTPVCSPMDLLQSLVSADPRKIAKLPSGDIYDTYYPNEPERQDRTHR